MIRFNSNSIPPYVIVDKLTDDPHPSGLTFGYWVKTKTGDERIDNGDFLHESDGLVRVIKYSEYTANQIIKDEVREIVGKNTMRSLFKLLDTLALTDVQEQDLVMRVTPTLVCLGDGFIHRAKKVISSTAIAGQLTLARRNAIISEIDSAIAIINGV